MQLWCTYGRENNAHAAPDRLLHDGENSTTRSTADHCDITARDDIPNDCHNGQSTMHRATSG
jgi:hypothetical protein